MPLEKLNDFSESFNLGCDKKAFGLRHNSKFQITKAASELLPFGNFKLHVKCCGIITGSVQEVLLEHEAVRNRVSLSFSAVFVINFVYA